MNKYIVVVDDAAHALDMAQGFLPNHQNAHWVLVACAPRLTRRVSKWVSNTSREQWRGKWADKLFAQLVPAWRPMVGQLNWVLANGPLDELTDDIQREGPAQIIDLRKPRLPDSNAQSTVQGRADWRLLVASGLGLLTLMHD